MHDVSSTGSLQHSCFDQDESTCIAAIINNVRDFLSQPQPGWCHSRVILAIYEIVDRKEKEA